MASEAVKKILEAEALSDKKNAEARRQREDIISSASGSSSLAIQKKISEATSEASKLRQSYDSKLESYRKKAWQMIASEVAKGRQAYVVCPMIEAGEGAYANPSSILKACCMMLRHIGLPEKAARLEDALEACVAGACRPVTGHADGASCEEFADAVLARV